MIGDRKAAKGARDTVNFEAAGLDQQARDALQIGDETAAHMAQSGRALVGAQRASIAGSGIDVSSGSAADIQANDARLNSMEKRP